MLAVTSYRDQLAAEVLAVQILDHAVDDPVATTEVSLDDETVGLSIRKA